MTSSRGSRPHPNAGSVRGNLKPNAQDRQRGFSLLECLVAMVIMAVAALGIAKLQLAFHSMSALARQRTEAMHLAEQKLEQLRAGAYATLSSGSDSPVLDWNTSYARGWSVEPAPDAVPYLMATINVHWIERTGQSQFVSLTSLIAKAEPADTALLRIQLDQASSGSHDLVGRRNAAIPLSAVRRGDGTSAVAVAGGQLIYDDVTGLVVSFCADPPALPGSPPTAPVCTPAPMATPPAPAPTASSPS